MNSKLLLAVPLALSLAAPALAQDPPAGLVVSGKLSKTDARAFIRSQLPDEAPQLLLKDERASFYSTTRTRVERPKHCSRVDRSQVKCQYKVRLTADKAHRDKGWFPIRCKGTILAARLSNDAIGGDPKNYKCVSLIPKD